MWEGKSIFRFLLPRVSKTKKSRTSLQIGRNDLSLDASGLGCDGNCELEKQKSKKRKVTGSKNPNKVTKKRKLVGEDGVSEQKIDRISELPEWIIHQIFSFLLCTKDVVRTTTLSKYWKSVFDSYQSFDFDQRWFRMPRKKNGVIGIQERNAQKNKFVEYVDRSVATRLARLECVHKFRFYADDVDFVVVACCLRSILAAKAKNVRELDIQVYGDKKMAIISLIICSSLTHLRLAVSMLRSLTFPKNCCLKVVSIKGSNFFNANMVKNLEENCPLLEDLRLVSCPNLSHIDISTLVKLKRIEVQDCAGVRRIKIAATDLETFWYHAEYGQECEIDLKGSENLRNLMLKNRVMSQSAFEDCISSFSLIEKLVLHNCKNIKKLTICSLALKSLTLIQCVRLTELDIDAPNLYSFEYDGRAMPFPFLRSSSRLSEAKISFKPNKWKSKLIGNFFRNVDGPKGCRLIVYTKQKMEIFEEPRRARVFETKHCKIELNASSSKLVKTIENWLRGCHGKSLLLSSSDELLKLLNTLILDREGDPSCCSFYSNKCWRHRIEGVKVSTLETEGKTSFAFAWRPRK